MAGKRKLDDAHTRSATDPSIRAERRILVVGVGKSMAYLATMMSMSTAKITAIATRKVAIARSTGNVYGMQSHSSS